MPDSSAAHAKPLPVTVFYCYAHEDQKLRDDLERHLKILQRRGLIQPWHDRAIVAGQLWDTEIHQELERAELVLLLLSSYFMGSDYILGVELKTALRRAAEGSATLVPILLRPLDLAALGDDMAPLLQRQGLPQDLKAVTKWGQHEEAWVNVSKGLGATVARIQAQRAAATPARPLAAGMLAPATAPDDLLLGQVLDSATDCIAAAQKTRNGTASEPAALRQQALALIDADHTPRLLWVDNHPEGNAAEVEMLARLQIEVVQVTSTDAATARLRSDAEAFDMVISDWHRGAEAPDAGLRLQQELTALGHKMPMVIYHAAFSTEQRLQRAASARSAGVFGEAVLPSELLDLVQAALKR